MVGQVPLGEHPAGKTNVPWDLKVSGKDLEPAAYLAELAIFGENGQKAFALDHGPQVTFEVTPDHKIGEVIETEFPAQ